MCYSPKWDDIIKWMKEDSLAAFQTARGMLLLACYLLRSGRAGEPLALTIRSVLEVSQIPQEHTQRRNTLVLFLQSTRAARLVPEFETRENNRHINTYFL